jgi:hypothetical protein
MIRHLVLLFLVLGSSNATKGLRRRAQNATDTPVTTGTTPPLIINTDGLPKAPKEEGLLPPKEEGLLTKEPKEEGLLPPKDPNDDAKIKADGLDEKAKEEKDEKVKDEMVKDEKEKKEKKDKTCKKRGKKAEDATGSTVPESSTRRSLQVITNEDGLAKKAEGEESTIAKKEPPVAKDNTAVPPEPASPPAALPVDDAVEPNVVEPDVVEPAAADVKPDVAPDNDAPFCADVGTKVRTQAECVALLSGGPNGKSIKGEVQFEVTYDEEKQSIMEKVQEKIKTRAALRAAGCATEERRVLRFLQDATADDASGSTLYISGVRFGEFAVNDSKFYFDQTTRYLPNWPGC